MADAREPIVELAGELCGIDLRAYEALHVDAQVTRVLPLATALVARGCALVAEISACCEPGRSDSLPPGLSFELTMDAAVEQTHAGTVQVSDVAFCAQLELRQRSQRLAEVAGSQDAITLLSECDGALRRLHKALVALDQAIAAALGAEPRLDFTSELARSLRVRRCYARLQLRILDEVATSSSLVARLRGVGTALAVLVGQPVYAELRIGDRLRLRALQSRLLDWLRAAQEPGAEAAGNQLWSDVTAFVAMLRQINRRQELCDHDAQAVRAAHAFAAAQPEAPFPATLRCRLELLLGLEPALDRLLREVDSPAAGAWLPILEPLASLGAAA